MSTLRATLTVASLTAAVRPRNCRYRTRCSPRRSSRYGKINIDDAARPGAVAGKTWRYND